MSNFTPSSEGVCIIAVNSTNTVLASGDAKGHVKLYNISEYCVGGKKILQDIHYTFYRIICLIQLYNIHYTNYTIYYYAFYTIVNMHIIQYTY